MTMLNIDKVTLGTTGTKLASELPMLIPWLLSGEDLFMVFKCLRFPVLLNLWVENNQTPLGITMFEITNLSHLYHPSI